jgi:proteasome alpha subunit
LVYDEPVGVETVTKYIADQFQKFTQYAGVRPMGVALIIGGVDKQENSLFLTDPSGTYIAYNAVAIGSNSDRVTEFLNKEYKQDMTMNDASILAAAAINLVSENKNDTNHIKISQIKSETRHFEFLPDSEIVKLAQSAKEKYVTEKK